MTYQVNHHWETVDFSQKMEQKLNIHKEKIVVKNMQLLELLIILHLKYFLEWVMVSISFSFPSMPSCICTWTYYHYSLQVKPLIGGQSVLFFLSFSWVFLLSMQKPHRYIFKLKSSYIRSRHHSNALTYFSYMGLQQIFENIINRDIPWPNVPEEISYEAHDLINK